MRHSYSCAWERTRIRIADIWFCVANFGFTLFMDMAEGKGFVLRGEDGCNCLQLRLKYDKAGMKIASVKIT